VCGEVLVPLLVSGVLGDEVEVLAADDERAVHLGGNDGAGQDTATDGNLSGERALLVCFVRKPVRTRASRSVLTSYLSVASATAASP